MLSLVKALSTHLSTASLDKNPQSKERGITLDLGFSSFVNTLPEFEQCIRDLFVLMFRQKLWIWSHSVHFSGLSRTCLLDQDHHRRIPNYWYSHRGSGCPQGNPDSNCRVHRFEWNYNKTGMFCDWTVHDQAIFVLNKIDLVPEKDRERVIKDQMGKLKKVLSKTRFSSAPIV